MQKRYAISDENLEFKVAEPNLEYNQNYCDNAIGKEAAIVPVFRDQKEAEGEILI